MCEERIFDVRKKTKDAIGKTGIHTRPLVSASRCVRQSVTSASVRNNGESHWEPRTRVSGRRGHNKELYRVDVEKERKRSGRGIHGGNQGGEINDARLRIHLISRENRFK